MCAAGAKVRNRTAGSGLANAACLRRNQRLVVNLCKNSRLDELCIDERRHDRQDWLIRVHDGAFRQRINIALKPEVLEIREEFFREHMLLTEIFHVLIRELHILDVFNDLFKTREDGKAAFIRILAVEYIECHLNILVVVSEITIGHGQFVKIHHHRDITFIKLRLRQ